MGHRRHMDTWTRSHDSVGLSILPLLQKQRPTNCLVWRRGHQRLVGICESRPDPHAMPLKLFYKRNTVLITSSCMRYRILVSPFYFHFVVPEGVLVECALTNAPSSIEREAS